ncbi:hypothetical protein KCU89_g3206, partial [Aureobasidium melanogenum]
MEYRGKDLIAPLSAIVVFSGQYKTVQPEGQAVAVTINNITFDGWSAVPNNEDGKHYCYNGNVYDVLNVAAQCLPASGNDRHARYEWSFSTVLMSLVLISHCIW